MDALQRCEMSYSDALRPVQQQMINGFMGDHKLMRPATYNDLQQFTSMVVSAINNKSLATYAATFPPVPALAPTAYPAQCFGPCFGQAPQQSAPHHCHPHLESAPATAVPTPVSVPTEPSAPSIARARIPNIPRGRGNWRTAVEQWDKLLKEWPEENFKGAMRTKTGTKRCVRRLIAEEYDR